jgi:hypothetical protein
VIGSVDAAARNNAEWCDAFCRSHSLEPRFDPEFWSSRERTPVFYPDAVTLRPGVDADGLLAAIDRSAGCSVKDSFDDLDLRGAGFEELFAAQWVCCEVGLRASQNGWAQVGSAEALSDWEAAWGSEALRIGFWRRSLLDDSRVRVLARYDSDGTICGGAVANRSRDVIGISNLFATDGDLETAWRGAGASAQAMLGTLPLVSYGSGEALDVACAAGFRTTGRLRVWTVAA